MLKLLLAMSGASSPLTSREISVGAAGLSAAEGSDQSVEQARDFHFAVTWVTLFAHLDLIEAAGPRRRVETPAPTLALVPVVAAPLTEQRAEQRSHAAWEMVVPKMIRSDDGNFAPASGEPKLL
jgi:hypothetical protein